MLHLLKTFPIPDFPKRDSWNPSNTLSRIADLSIQFIHLFQREAFRFINHEINERNADEATTSPDEEDFGLQIGIAWPIVYQIWCGVRDRPIQKPVRGCCHRKRLGANL